MQIELNLVKCDLHRQYEYICHVCAFRGGHPFFFFWLCSFPEVIERTASDIYSSTLNVKEEYVSILRGPSKRPPANTEKLSGNRSRRRTWVRALNHGWRDKDVGR